MRSCGFIKILIVKICGFFDMYLVHAARILELSLEVMLSPPKRGTKHLYFTTLKAFPSSYNTFSEAKYKYNIFQKPNTSMFLRCDSWL